MDIRQRIRDLQGRLQRLLRSPSEELGRGGRFLAYQIRLWSFCGRKLLKDRLQVTASALSFKTMLSLVPVLVLFSLILTLVPEGEIRQGIRSQVFKAAGLTEISGDPDRPGADGDEPASTEAGNPDGAAPLENGPPPAEAGIATTGAEGVGSLADRLTGMVGGVVADIRGGTSSITVISIVLFIWAGMSIFKTVEGAFNYIWEVRRGRSLFVRFRDFVTSIILLVLLVGMAIWWTQQEGVGTIIAGTSGVIPLLATWLLFFIVYKTLPTVRVQTRAALSAALLAGTVWELGAKTAFVLYLKYAMSGTLRLYGSLALIPVFMIWVWVSWIIVLFGAELGYVIQNMGDLARDQMESETRNRFLRGDLVALALATEVARRFSAGEPPPTRRELSAAIGASEGDVEEVAEALRREDLIRNAERNGPGRAVGYQPARPPAEITAARVVGAAASVELHPSASGERGRLLRWAGGYMNEISGGAAQALAAETLDSLSRRLSAS